MKTIWKFPIEVTDEQTIEIPKEAKILCVQVQQDKICLWALLDEMTEGKEKRIIRVIGTGHPIPESEQLVYIGTVQLHFGSLIFHVFERR